MQTKEPSNQSSTREAGNVYEKCACLLRQLQVHGHDTSKSCQKDSNKASTEDMDGQTEIRPLAFIKECGDSRDGSSDSVMHQSPIPDCLHSGIPYNRIIKEDNFQSCHCSSGNKMKWALHNVFHGEKEIPPCSQFSNNSDKLRCYSLSISPSINFKAEFPTKIKHDGKIFKFKGFYILSHFSLRKIPKCHFAMYKQKYVVEIKRESIPKNFNIRDLEMFHNLVFETFLEIHDWNMHGKQGGCRPFHFLPRFVLCTDDSAQGRNPSRRDKDELLSMTAVLEHLLESHEPIIKPRHLKRSRSEWIKEGLAMKDFLVLFPGKRPSCIRMDGMDLQRDPTLSQDFPAVLHNARQPFITANARKFERLKRKKSNLQCFQEDSALPEKEVSARMRTIQDGLTQCHERESSKSRIIRLSSQGCCKTGIKNDIFQHTMVLYVAVKHIRYHRSLDYLEERINYKFKERSILEKSLRHVSLPNIVTNFSNIMVSSYNCGLSDIRYGTASQSNNRKRSLRSLQGTMEKLPTSQLNPSPSGHNESLEFLGDAVLEFITTKHLFFMFGKKSEGELSQYRSLLVENVHLTSVAKRLEIENFMLFGHGNWKALKMDHILANCVEAVLAAVYLDGGLETAKSLVRMFYFQEKDLQRVWTNIPRHELQERAPTGDRQLILNSHRLQHLVKLEEQLGLQFTHISLLARAFTCHADSEDSLTGGNNQRLEFLGDSLLKYIVSDYVFHHFPDHPEGHLTLLRSSLVNAKVQATIFKELGLDAFIEEDDRAWAAVNRKMLANFFEAFFAAIYVDKGIEYCKRICDVVLFPRLETSILNRGLMDPKSELQNRCSYLREEKNRNENPVYKLIEATGPIPFRKFTSAVYFKGDQIGTGTGASIPASEVAAANDALESSYFEVADKQSRISEQKHGRKRVKRKSKNAERIDGTEKDYNAERDDEFSPKWIDL